ncbi:MAG: hypothetical protein MJ077_00230 [Oscillospiraceae bacterium]|nr:hypothetical protein [Oscillospiraceae bacterium]
MSAPYTTHHQIRPEHLNHHRTLYAGQMTEWMIETAFVTAVGIWNSTDHIVMAGINSTKLTRPMVPGNILQLTGTVSKLGTTSISIKVEGIELISKAPCCLGEFVFVTVDDQGHKMPHGLTL